MTMMRMMTTMATTTTGTVTKNMIMMRSRAIMRRQLVSSSSSSSLLPLSSSYRRILPTTTTITTNNNSKHYVAATTRTAAYSSIRYNNILYEKRIWRKGKAATTSIQQVQVQVPSQQQRYYQQFIRRGFVHQSDTSDTNTTNNNNSEDGDGDDFFKLFDIPRKFGIALPLLKERYLKLMIEYHPDKQQHQQQQHQHQDRTSIITAETITNAYQILQLPHTRANHLLELYNCPLMEYDNTNDNNNNNDNKNNDNNNNNDNDMSQFVGMDFLMDMMEYRERIEDLVHANSNNKQDEFRTISKETRLLKNQCEESLKDLLDNNEDDDNDNNNNDTIVLFLLEDDDIKLQEARKLTAQLQYWYRLECTLKEEMDI
ncbi:HscB domain-containing co-chaperone [Fragilariopsis cylindrus CCMP1102]|uniref:HscB domain-containing co-chaperone n=1 Tax=Fragilariopsis cylindrus CCMP1102 TaxID=635003 RepID=A0A1E7FZV5_9STRA|nr:HscB domain-containing co-chaperone [Fragilariopsis cylindrus CCMP1102]|eukprot:OEU23681.1 HscB domain-containing co-chaperone [Fragilariopsis cylindrus CCMP1102]